MRWIAFPLLTVTGLTLMLPGIGQAQDLVWTPEATEACLAAAVSPEARDACVGTSAGLCINTPDGYTTVGFAACSRFEAEYWDTRLNEAYAGLMEIEQRLDAEMAQLGSAAPSVALALREMQRAWIVFRDASCAYAASQFGTGTGSGPAAADCVMRLTGEQALDLERQLAGKTAQ
ncbi:MAG: lysozyme inhibitor LprI family protein [Pseudomonadota bacterium]